MPFGLGDGNARSFIVKLNFISSVYFICVIMTLSYALMK